MLVDLTTSIVRILKPDGKAAGTGFVVSDDSLVVTCAHVVTRVLGLPSEAGDTPAGKVYLDFPLVAPGHILTAQVVIWQPEEDIAGLQLDQEPPAGVQPARLATADDLWGHPLRVFGFPLAYENGVWASGVLRARNAAGWVQIEDVKQTGYFVQPGFSGAPVWDEELGGVVGMIVAADMEPGVRAAFLIPTVSAWSTFVRWT